MFGFVISSTFQLTLHVSNSSLCYFVTYLILSYKVIYLILSYIVTFLTLQFNHLVLLCIYLSYLNPQSISPLITSSSATLYWQDGTRDWTCLQSICRHNAVDVSVSSYSLLQTSCSLQWQDAVKVLIKPLSDCFKAMIKHITHSHV